MRDFSLSFPVPVFPTPAVPFVVASVRPLGKAAL